LSRLDELMPAWDARERHERRVPASPRDAVGAALGIPVAPDPLVRALFRLRGLPGGGSIEGAMRALGFERLVREDDCAVLGAAGRPWSPRGRIGRFSGAGPGEIRMLLEISATPVEGGALLATETRVAAVDDAARRAFRRYWLAVGPFSAFVRRRWLAAAERALR
jgi:hypothetical protein